MLLLRATQEFIREAKIFGAVGAPIAAQYWWLEQAFRDLDDGIAHSMFQPVRKGRGAPRLSGEQRRQRWAAGQALEYSMQLGHPKDQAAASIARRLDPRAFRKRGGRAVEATTVIEWYHEFVTKDGGAAILHGDGQSPILVDGTSDAALSQMVDQLIALANNEAFAMPLSDFITALKAVAKSD
jgi:hypothetical protein